MIRNKTYNLKKNKGFNLFFKNQYDYKDIKFCNVKNIIINKHPNFNIIKDEILYTYVISFKDIIVIHLEEKEYQDFIYLYKNSDKYSFDVYSTINYENIIIYHIFCTSKFLDKNQCNFLDGNECEYKYRCLDECYGSCLVINRNVMIDEFSSKYVFVKHIGLGTNTNQFIKSLIQQVISLINTYYIKYLPINYLNI